MENKTYSQRKILSPCSLDAFSYQLDPYNGCGHLCYYCYALNSTDINWEKEIIAYANIAEKLTEELALLEPQTIYIGMNTDPYQPIEKKCFQTRKVVKLLLEKGFSVSILTKSHLITRDIDLLCRDYRSSVGVSIAFHSEDLKQLFEKNTPPVIKRIEALKKLKNAGIHTYTLICPVMPFITAMEEIIEMVEPYSDTIWIYKLQIEHKKDKNWTNINRIIKNRFPQLTANFAEVVFSKNHPYWDNLRNKAEKIKTETETALKIEF